MSDERISLDTSMLRIRVFTFPFIAHRSTLINMSLFVKKGKENLYSWVVITSSLPFFNSSCEMK